MYITHVEIFKLWNIEILKLSISLKASHEVRRYKYPIQISIMHDQNETYVHVHVQNY